MRRTSFLPYLFFAFVLFWTLSLPDKFSNSLRARLVSMMGDSWEHVSLFRNLLFRVPTFHGREEVKSKDVLVLEMENHNLKSQISALQEWLLFDGRVDDEIQRLKALKNTSVDDLYWKDFFSRRSEELASFLEMKLQAVPAKVVFREPVSWSSSLWINVGEKENERLSRQVVAVDSPVVLGNKLVGIVEYVGEKRSRIRLLTDSGLVPSVRALRGNRQDDELRKHIQSVTDRLQIRRDLFSNEDERQAFIDVLNQLKQRLSQIGEDRFLAKGELMGSSSPLWRSREPILKGKRFNYDYEDAEGPARDLRDGTPRSGNLPALPLLKVGDLLVTTGMDGFFPAGLEVAIVTKVHDLKPGAYAYDLEARPVVENFTDLQSVFVLPPLD